MKRIGIVLLATIAMFACKREAPQVPAAATATVATSTAPRDPWFSPAKAGIVDRLVRLGDLIPNDVELGYHLCYGSPADEHMVLPKDMGIMVEMTNAIVASVKRPIQFVHMPVVKARTDDAYFAPLKNLKLKPGTELHLGLIHYNDANGDMARLAAARRHARVDGIGTECGMARGDPARLPSLLAAHAKIAEGAA